MDEKINVVNDTPQAVVEPAAEAETENSGIGSETSEADAESGAAPRVQSKADNRAAASMRRAREAAEAQNKLLRDGLAKLGYTGDNPQDILDAINAKTSGVTVEEIRQQRADAQKAVENDPRYKEMENRLIQIGIAEDLKVVQEIDPSVKTVDDLDTKFFTLRKNGIDAKTAYLAIKGSKTETPKPVNTGAVSGANDADDGYFTSAELDKLTPKDLDDPKIYKKAMRSLGKL